MVGDESDPDDELDGRLVGTFDGELEGEIVGEVERGRGGVGVGGSTIYHKAKIRTSAIEIYTLPLS